MATFNANAIAPNQPKVPHAAEAVERFQTYVTTTSALANGDVIKMNNLKLPMGAQIVDVRLLGKSVDGQGIFQIGTDYVGQAAAFGSATMSVVQTIKAQIIGLPYNVSVSDDFQPRYVTMQLTVDGAPVSLTLGLSMTLFVRYVMDP